MGKLSKIVLILVVLLVPGPRNNDGKISLS
jgi:hypothetical protein